VSRLIIAVPGRLASSRFPDKLLIDVFDKPVLHHTLVGVKSYSPLFFDSLEVIFFGQDKQLCDLAANVGVSAILVEGDFVCGSERVAQGLATQQVHEELGFASHVIVVQGDEPLIESELLMRIEREVFRKRNVGKCFCNLMSAVNPAETFDENVVKFDGHKFYRKWGQEDVFSDTGNLASHKKVLGVYGSSISDFIDWFLKPRSKLEENLSVEQQRILDNLGSIIPVDSPSDLIGVNTPDDLEKVRCFLKEGGGV